MNGLTALTASGGEVGCYVTGEKCNMSLFIRMVFTLQVVRVLEHVGHVRGLAAYHIETRIFGRLYENFRRIFAVLVDRDEPTHVLRG